MSQLVSQPSASSGGAGTNGAGSSGGFLASSTATSVSATGAGARTNNPQAGSGPDQSINTAQQNLPMVGVEAAISTILDDENIEDLYNRMIRVANQYYEEFREDNITYWRSVYRPLLKDVIIKVATETLSYEGDGRGSSLITADRDLFQRGHMAVEFIKPLDQAWFEKRRITDRYMHGQMRMDDIDISLKRFGAMIDQSMAAKRIEDVREDEFNARRWNRLLQMANIGFSGTNAAMAGYTGAVGAHVGALQSMANFRTARNNQISAFAGNMAQSFLGDSNG